MARKQALNTTSLTNYGNHPKPEEGTTRKINPRSLENLRPRAKGAKPKKYMQLDIADYEDYLNRMSKYKKMTRTKYITELIRQDYELHKDEYNLLKNLTEFDKKH